MSTSVGRNAPCPCGSGKKYKRCCALKRQQGLSARGWLMLSAIGLMLLAGAVMGLSSLDDPNERQGPARVWHGDHWH